MSKKTHTNPLSRQEVEKLRKNPYIASVTANTVRFTEAFKDLAYEKKIQGVPVAETMSNNLMTNPYAPEVCDIIVLAIQLVILTGLN